MCGLCLSEGQRFFGQRKKVVSLLQWGSNLRSLDIGLVAGRSTYVATESLDTNNDAKSSIYVH